MTDQELEALLDDLESDRVERKSSFVHKDKLCEAICAFANDLPNHRLPGVLFIGARDDGTCANLPIDDRALLSLGDLKSNGQILPFSSMTVEKRTLKGGAMAVVIVEPSEDTPVRFAGRTWIRVGPRRALATPEEERRLAEKRKSKTRWFDLSPEPTATIEDLDRDLFYRHYLPKAVPKEIIAQNNRSYEHQLAGMRFITTDPQPKPTNLGLLVIGKDPRYFLPAAYVQFLRIGGTEIIDSINVQKEMDGPLPELMKKIDETIEEHIFTSLMIPGKGSDIRISDYPQVALQQLIQNALLHRSYDGTGAPVQLYWYEDRVEITSPGGPYGKVTHENFGAPNLVDYRNPHLAEAMKNLGQIQRFGVGISLAQSALAKNGNPPAEFIVDDAYIRVIVRKRP